VYDEVITREGPAFLVGRAALLTAECSRAVVKYGEIAVASYTDYFAYRAAVDDWWFNPSGAVTRADEVRKISGFWQSRELCEDIDFWQRLGAARGFVQVIEPRTYAYRLHDGGAHHGYHTLYRGLKRMILAEKENRYPGGKSRARDRLSIIASHARHHALEFAATEPALAWKLYFLIFPWNLMLGRWKFLAGFFPVAVARWMKRWRLGASCYSSFAG
jgi:hypothetical protein